MADRFFIAEKLREIGRLLAAKGENPFKIRAYDRAARALEQIGGDFDALVSGRGLTTIRGIGAALAAVIEEIHRTGDSSLLKALREELPRGIGELSLVPGLTVKKIAALASALPIASVAELKAACAAAQVRAVKGFGAKTEAKLLAAIEKLEKGESRALLDRATEEGERLLSYVRAGAGVAAAAIGGALRRRRESIRRIEIVAAAENAGAAIDHFLRFPALVPPLERSADHCRARLAGGLLAELHVARPRDYAAALLRFTGSKKHYARLEVIAREKKLAIDSPANGKAAAKDEAAIYRRLGMALVPPELREDAGEIEAARAGKIPELITAGDIRGMTHCHTVYSDGKNTVEEMARAADALGFEYLTITDHSPSAHYAGGVGLDRLEAQWEEIARAQEKVKVRLLRGTESDIREDGALDYPDEVLERFDIVIASIHQRYKMSAEQMTRRIAGAMKRPGFKVWGHPLGRLIHSRAPLECDMEKVLDAAAESGAAIEVNGDPRRLDLEPRWIRAARARGIKFIVSTDAHSTGGMRNLRYGVDMARRGWLGRGDILNTLDASDFIEAVRP